MRKYYKFGELLFTLRNEYLKQKVLLEELKKYVDINDDYLDMYFSGRLVDDSWDYEDKGLSLIVTKKYNELLKKIQDLRYDWYSVFLYRAKYNFVRNEDGIYTPVYDNIYSFVDKKYVPEVRINDNEQFGLIADIIYSTDLMNTKHGNFAINDSRVCLDYDEARIYTNCSKGTNIKWNGVNDELTCSTKGRFYPALVRDVLSFDMPADRISDDWIELLKNNEKNISNKYDIDELEKSGIKLILK